jgi:hypothetical protein
MGFVSLQKQMVGYYTLLRLAVDVPEEMRNTYTLI